MMGKIMELLGGSTSSTSKRYKKVSPQELSRTLPRFRVIDVRQPDEFAGELGHLQGAELVPLATLAQTARDWSRSEPLLLVCRSGNRSGQGCNQLVGMGFTDVTNLEGGMLAVRASGK